jgi:hypothetical protein
MYYFYPVHPYMMDDSSYSRYSSKFYKGSRGEKLIFLELRKVITPEEKDELKQLIRPFVEQEWNEHVLRIEKNNKINKENLLRKADELRKIAIRARTFSDLLDYANGLEQTAISLEEIPGFAKFDYDMRDLYHLKGLVYKNVNLSHRESQRELQKQTEEKENLKAEKRQEFEKMADAAGPPPTSFLAGNPRKKVSTKRKTKISKKK